MSEESPSKQRGCLARAFSVFLLVISIGLAVALYYAFQPQDLSDIKGYGVAAAPPKRDLKLALQNSIERSYDLSLSEGEINTWLRQSVSLKQGGLLGGQVKLKGIAVRLEDGYAEVIMERLIFGKSFTVSMYLRIEQLQKEGGVSTTVDFDNGPFSENFPKLKKGGRFGQLVVPQGFLVLVLPAYRELRDQLEDVIKLGFTDMSRVRIEDETLKLDPRAGTDRDSIAPGTF